MAPRHIVFASYGNDSIALIQWCRENGLADVAVLYSNTGWAIEWWADRVAQAEAWVASIGYTPVSTKAVGFPDLARSKQMFPRPKVQFCTEHLKVMPAMAWMDEADPDRLAVCFVGVRREESKTRQTYEAWRDDSPAHGGRCCWAPLADYGEAARDDLIAATPMRLLTHRSKECFPCINSNRPDLRMLAERPVRVDEIRSLESDLGLTARGASKTLFRPGRYGGAVGIDEVVRWALSERGEYAPPDVIDEPENCDGGYCGT